MHKFSTAADALLPIGPAAVYAAAAAAVLFALLALILLAVE